MFTITNSYQGIHHEHYIIVSGEAAKQGVKVGGEIVSRSMSTDGSVGTSETPKGMRRQIEEKPAYTEERRITANVKTYAVIVCNEGKEDRVLFE